MKYSVGGRTFTVDVQRADQRGPTAIVIPQHATVELTQLAIEAIRAYTPPDTIEIWVVDNVSARRQRETTLALGVSVILNRTAPWQWEGPLRAGSWANGVALELARRVLVDEPPRRLFCMHNDALPIRSGWLDFLCQRPEAMIGCKASQRNGYPHSAGVLFDFAALTTLGPDVLLPHLPAWDVAEGPARQLSHWSAWGLTHQGPRCVNPCPVSGWLEAEEVEISWDETGRPFYLHKGGGTINGRDMSDWIARARKALSL